MGGKKNMKNILRKTWLIGIVILFVGASVLPSISANINEAGNITKQSQPEPLMVFWEDNFDSYVTGSALAGQGGWEGWGNDPGVTAYVSDNQSRSSPNSVDIRWYDTYSADIVQRFTGVDSGTWILTLWQYIPSDLYGTSWIPLLNVYDPPTYTWSTDIQFDGDLGEVLVYEDPAAYLPMIFNQWVEIRVEIDFDVDLQTIYYDGDLLSSIPWGNPNFAALDLYAGDTETNSVYYDDISLEFVTSEEPNLECDGDLDWVDVEIGTTVTGNFTVENIGSGELSWEIESYPDDWGEWTFSDMSGTGVVPGTPVIIDVEVEAPDIEEETFTGEVVLVNTEDSNNTCVIDVSLVTPVPVSHNMPFLQWFMNRHPIIAEILGF